MPNKQSLYTLPPGHRLLVLSTGRTATFRTDSADIDSGCSFCLYIPSTHPLSQRARDTPRSRASDADSSGTDRNDQLSKGPSARRPALAFPLLVLVHSSRNDGQLLRDEWSDWAEEHQVVLLSVIFPYRFLVSFLKLLPSKQLTSGWAGGRELEVTGVAVERRKIASVRSGDPGHGGHGAAGMGDGGHAAFRDRWVLGRCSGACILRVDHGGVRRKRGRGDRLCSGRPTLLALASRTRVRPLVGRPWSHHNSCAITLALRRGRHSIALWCHGRSQAPAGSPDGHTLPHREPRHPRSTRYHGQAQRGVGVGRCAIHRRCGCRSGARREANARCPTSLLYDASGSSEQCDLSYVCMLCNAWTCQRGLRFLGSAACSGTGFRDR